MDINLKKYIVDLKNLKSIERISSGSFGTVYLAQDSKTGHKFAAKILHFEVEQDKKLINREIGIMIRNQHPTIIKFYGYSMTDFEGKNNVTLLLQYAQNGSLSLFLKKVRKGLLEHLYDNTCRQKILVGIARGMMYLHKHNIIHRDLKPGNILLDDKLEPHITDFGASKFHCFGQSFNQTQNVGTSIYMAPEVIEGINYNGKADVYSFAILMYEVVTDTVPFENFQNGKMSLFQFNKKVVDEDYRPKFKVPVKASIRSLIEQCWSKDQNKRPTFEEIFNRLAFNVEESVYDVFQGDEETPKYYLDDVDQDELLFYVDEINRELFGVSSNSSFSSHQIDMLSEKVQYLERENTKMAEIVQKQSDEIKQLKDEIENMKKQNKLEKVPKTAAVVDYKKTKSSGDSHPPLKVDSSTKIKVPGEFKVMVEAMKSIGKAMIALSDLEELMNELSDELNQPIGNINEYIQRASDAGIILYEKSINYIRFKNRHMSNMPIEYV